MSEQLRDVAEDQDLPYLVLKEILELERDNLDLDVATDEVVRRLETIVEEADEL